MKVKSQTLSQTPLSAEPEARLAGEGFGLKLQVGVPSLGVAQLVELRNPGPGFSPDDRPNPRAYLLTLTLYVSTARPSATDKK